jgi:hypothetical protein
MVVDRSCADQHQGVALSHHRGIRTDVEVSTAQRLAQPLLRPLP